MFPIIFASIMGRLMYQIARWKLERGVSLGTLEQLMGSRTLGSTVLTQFELRAFNALSLTLLVAWIFSPLGGQSLLRLLELRSHPVDSSITYYDVEFPTNLAEENTNNSVGDSTYVTALLTPDLIRKDTMDVWGNVKIPFLESYGVPNDSKWQNITRGQNLEYSALVGIPIANISTGNSTFAIESSYVHLECTQPKKAGTAVSYVIATYETLFNETGINATKEQWPANGTWNGFQQNSSQGKGNWNLALDRFVDEMWSSADNQLGPLLVNQTKIKAKPANLFFQGRFIVATDPDRGDIVKSKCKVFQKYVQSKIECSRISPETRQNCSVVAQQPSKKKHLPGSISHLSFPLIFEKISLNLPQAAGDSKSRSDLSLNYIKYSSAFEAITGGTVGLESIAAKVFSLRLSQLINSYLLANQIPMDNLMAGNGNLRANSSAHETATAKIYDLAQFYYVPRFWAAISYISCVVLLVSGTLSVVFAHLAIGPEVLGFASTVIRDSRYMDLHPDIGRMNGVDIAFVLKDERVRYGYTHLTRRQRPLVGVGRQEEIRLIKPNPRGESDAEM
ncbi:hypothetical protein BKA56DRAFT_74502 [Ilyonectria sp. MPI-CAGE-AT-0026]|nr:hypothetical protein BKA56DRAFT_74502 [Ilyonectria sp. MPI-CAGE-AT-0026]